MDPAARAKAVQRNAEDSAKKERQQQYEGKRRQMADELERSEKEALQKRQDADRIARQRAAKIVELQEESRRLVKRKQEEMNAKAKQKSDAVKDKRRKDEELAKADQEPESHPLDRTVRVQFPASQLAQLAGTTEGEAAAPAVPLSTPLANTLSNQFGELEHLQFQLPASGKKMKRELMALATFKSLQDAWQAVVTGGEMRCTGLLEESFIGWRTTRRCNVTEARARTRCMLSRSGCSGIESMGSCVQVTLGACDPPPKQQIRARLPRLRRMPKTLRDKDQRNDPQSIRKHTKHRHCNGSETPQRTHYRQPQRSHNLKQLNEAASHVFVP